MRAGLPRFVPPRKIDGPMVYFPAGPSGDYDNDGRVDLFLINWFSENHSRLLHNESPRRHWLKVKGTGNSFNRMGIGSQIRVYRAGQLRRRGRKRRRQRSRRRKHAAQAHSAELCAPLPRLSLDGA